MSDRFRIEWDVALAILHVYHGPGLWTDADFDLYERELTDKLADAPAGGFDLLLDQSDTIPQTQEVTNRRGETLKSLLNSGMRRAVIIAPRTVVGMQSERVNRQSGADSRMFTICKSREEALALLA